MGDGMLPTNDAVKRAKLTLQRVLADALPGIIPHPPRPAQPPAPAAARLSREELQRLFGSELSLASACRSDGGNVITLASRRRNDRPPTLVLRPAMHVLARTGS